MPLITVPVEQIGPVLTVAVGVSVPRAGALVAHGQSAPPPVMGRFLLDTGASKTCVDLDLIVPLGLPRINSVLISTPSTGGKPATRDQFDASVIIQGNSPDVSYLVAAIPIIATHFRSQGIDGLIGRDVIDLCMLVYNGPARTVTLGH